MRAAVGKSNKSATKSSKSAGQVEVPPKNGKTRKATDISKKDTKGIVDAVKKSSKEKFPEIAPKLPRTLISNSDVFDQALGGLSQSEIDGTLSVIGTGSPDNMTAKEKHVVKPESKRKYDDEVGEMEPNSKRVSRKPVITQKSSSPLSGDSQSSNLVTVAGIEKKKLAEAGSREYVYKIDCERVANHVNVDDLRKHLQKEMKVNGQKNNLDHNISLSCEDRKVVITSKVFLPKRYLLFLAKKFLKKKSNMQVVSTDAHAYAFKYVGTA